MSRSIWKLPFFHRISTQTSNIKLHRSNKIMLQYLDNAYWIYNGKTFELITISYFHIGLSVGELYMTRGIKYHAVNKKRNKKKSTKKKHK